MPSAADFDAAATIFDRSADELDQLVDGPRRVLDSGVIAGGSLLVELIALFDHVRRSMAGQADSLRSLALTCRMRADETRSYQQLLRLYEAAMITYGDELRRWLAAVDAYAANPSLPPPGSEPVAPLPPVALPWPIQPS